MNTLKKVGRFLGSDELWHVLTLIAFVYFLVVGVWDAEENYAEAAYYLAFAGILGVTLAKQQILWALEKQRVTVNVQNIDTLTLNGERINANHN